MPRRRLPPPSPPPRRYRGPLPGKARAVSAAAGPLPAATPLSSPGGGADFLAAGRAARCCVSRRQPGATTVVVGRSPTGGAALAAAAWGSRITRGSEPGWARGARPWLLEGVAASGFTGGLAPWWCRTVVTWTAVSGSSPPLGSDRFGQIHGVEAAAVWRSMAPLLRR